MTSTTQHQQQRQRQLMGGNFSSTYVSYKLSSFSKTQIRDLRKRFSSELLQVRRLINRTTFYSNSTNAVDSTLFFNECAIILTKLLKHKFAYVFNSPVNVVALKLHDYYTIVKFPMDLGTVKAKLNNNLYSNPMEFAEDVRLTFNNAILYNPLTNEVNGMAHQMLASFEDLFRPIQNKIAPFFSRQIQPRVFNPLPSPRRTIKIGKPRTEDIQKPIEKIQQMPAVAHQQELITDQLLPTLSVPVKETTQKGVGRPGGKQPKPRARDENKREMSMDEMQKLMVALQSIPLEKMQQLVLIIRKRNERFAQDSDEVELDMTTLDTETLWELDRFVTNWKKNLSRNKRQSQSMSNPVSSVPAPSSPVTEIDMDAMSDKNVSVKKPKFNAADDEDVNIDDDMPATHFPTVVIEKDDVGGDGEDRDQGAMSDKNVSVKKPKDNAADDEDVDIDDDMPATLFPTVVIEKDDVGGDCEDRDQGQDQKDNGSGNTSSSSSSSGSSGSDSSSSRDSDSGSSSGSDSEADEAQS